MAITALDPVSALVVIDMQKGIVAGDKAHPTQHIIANTVRLADEFRARGLPVILVNVTGGAPGRTESGPGSTIRPDNWAELVTDLKVQPSDILITKHQWGAFYNTDLDNQLKKQNVTQIVLAGIATSMGVESTARAAYERGYNVAFVTDAMTDFSAEAHANSIRHIFPKIGETGTTKGIIELLNNI